MADIDTAVYLNTNLLEVYNRSTESENRYTIQYNPVASEFDFVKLVKSKWRPWLD